MRGDETSVDLTLRERGMRDGTTEEFDIVRQAGDLVPVGGGSEAGVKR